MIALCYSGNLRTFAQCVKSHAQVFGPTDVYMSISDQWGYTDKLNDPWHSKGERMTGEITRSLIESMLPKEFALKRLKITPASELIFKDRLRKDNHLLYQYWYMRDCFELIDQDYDFIVRIRPDITIESAKLSFNKIVFSEYVWYNKKYDGRIMNEMIWIAPPKLMAKSVSILKNIPEIDKNLPLVGLYGESVFHEHLRIEGLLDKKDLFNFNWRVLR